MMEANLKKPADAVLLGAHSVEELARLEGWSPQRYALGLSEAIRDSCVPLDAQRERLAALAAMAPGLGADQHSADALAQHFAVLEALWQRFAFAAHGALKEAQSGNEKKGQQGAADRYLSAALRAQRAAMQCLSALKVLRDAQAPTTSPTTSAPAPALLPVLLADGPETM
jgi:hypothetical protein